MDEKSQSLGGSADCGNAFGGRPEGLWKADDTTRDRLKELYLSVEGELEDANDEES